MPRPSPVCGASAGAEYAGGLSSTRDDAGTDPENVAMSGLGTGSKQANGVRHGTVAVNGLDIFYREGGPSDAPTLVLPHGFPAASHHNRELVADFIARNSV